MAVTRAGGLPHAVDQVLEIGGRRVAFDPGIDPTPTPSPPPPPGWHDCLSCHIPHVGPWKTADRGDQLNLLQENPTLSAPGKTGKE